MLLKSTTLVAVLSAALGLVDPAAAGGGAVGAVPGDVTADPGYSPAVGEDSVYPGRGDPGVDVLGYHLDLRWAPKPHRLDATATLRLRATAPSASIRLALGAPLKVAKVTVGGKKARFRHDGNTLVVTRATPFAADRGYTVAVRYSGTPRTVKAPTSRVDEQRLGWHSGSKGQVWTIQEPYGAFTWYPVNDQPSDKATYTIRLNVPKRWVGVAGGRMAAQRTTAKRSITVFTSRHPMASYLTTVAIGPYERHTQQGPHGLPLSYWVPKGREDLLAPLRHTPGALRWLERRLGRYPFDRAGVVVTPGSAATATRSLVTFGIGNYRYGPADVRATLLHELAQAWYGDTVTPADWRDLWMNEGMAMYLQARYTAAKGWKSWHYWIREFTRDDGFYREIYGPPGDYHKREFGQINVSYCSALMLDRLRKQIGNKDFWSAARAWPQRHEDTNQTRARYIRWLERRTGEELTAFFHDWLDSPDTPKG